jgi:molybdenum cofactor biosynthesis protein MoaC
MSKLSHVNTQGEANMVDVSGKPIQRRTAIASGFISLQPGTILLIRENGIKKGDVLTVARIAGIQAAKETSRLIPLCHNILLNKVNVETILTDIGVEITATVICQGQTGVEMEALTAVSVALLTVYDMCKAADKTMEISQIKLIDKQKTSIE